MQSGRNPYAVIPGGARQRTLAYRFGVNLVMYALTGNYKGDQVHVPAILRAAGAVKVPGYDASRSRPSPRSASSRCCRCG